MNQVFYMAQMWVSMPTFSICGDDTSKRFNVNQTSIPTQSIVRPMSCPCHAHVQCDFCVDAIFGYIWSVAKSFRRWPITERAGK